MEENEQIQVRKQTIKELQSQGVDVFGRKFSKESSLIDCIDQYEEGKEVKTAGRVKAKRGHGKMFFSDIEDMTGKLQLFIGSKQIKEGYFELFEQVDIGDLIGVEGKLFTTRTGEISLMVESFDFLAKSMRPLPEKWHGLKDIEIRYRRRSLDLISNKDVAEVFRKRIMIIKEMRSFLDEKGFLEVETPMMQSIPGGADAKPFITHHEALNIDLFLRVAPELYLKRLLVGGFEKVYEINRNFRNEGISRFHNPEFTMMELYSAFDDYNDMMNLTEELVVYLCDTVIGTRKVLNEKGEEIDLNSPWERIPYREALKKYTGNDFTDEVQLTKKCIELKVDKEEMKTTADMLDAVFKREVEPHLKGPVFIIDYPAETTALAKLKVDDPTLVERFELFVNYHELANAYSELNDPIQQRERFIEQTKKTKKQIDEDFLVALEYGMPCAGGLGIGIDRLVMMLTGVSSIRDVIFFPQLKPQK